MVDQWKCRDVSVFVIITSFGVSTRAGPELAHDVPEGLPPLAPSPLPRTPHIRGFGLRPHTICIPFKIDDLFKLGKNN